VDVSSSARLWLAAGCTAARQASVCHRNKCWMVVGVVVADADDGSSCRSRGWLLMPRDMHAKITRWCFAAVYDMYT
jgi:hypothetical protein